MNKNELKTEVLLVSKYCLILKQILAVHKQLSVNKILFFAYLLKNENNYYSALFNGNTSNDVVVKAISQISGNYTDYCKNIPYIIEAMHLLIENGDILLNNSTLLCSENSIGKEKYTNKFLQNAINESYNFSDRQFLKEVLSNV